MPIIGWFVFHHANASEVMKPSQTSIYLDSNYVNRGIIPAEYPRFNSLIFSIDALIPLVKLHQEEFWLPDHKTNGTWIIQLHVPRLHISSPKWPRGWLVRWYLWFHIGMGWVLTSLLVTYVSGKIRKD